MNGRFLSEGLPQQSLEFAQPVVRRQTALCEVTAYGRKSQTHPKAPLVRNEQWGLPKSDGNHRLNLHIDRNAIACAWLETPLGFYGIDGRFIQFVPQSPNDTEVVRCSISANDELKQNLPFNMC